MYVPAAGYGGARASPLSDTPASEKETYVHEQEQIPWMPLASIFIAPNLKNHYRRGEHQRHGPAARSLLVVFTGLDRARVPNVQPSALTPALHSAAAQCACVPLPLLHVLTKQFEQMDRLFSEIRQVFFGSCANKYYTC